MNRHSHLKIACPSCSQKLDVSGYEPFEEVGCPTCGCTILVPRLFGDFLLEEIIGQGGMAIVYRALDLTLHRDVAIKVLNEDIAAEEGAAERFLREGRAAAAINHINVVPIYSAGQVEDLPCLVMQYMEGLSLDRQLERIEGGASMDFCFQIASEAALGLQAALREGIIHHDVKPANILLDADGVAKVGDFGLAQLLRGDIGEHSLEAEHWATPYYVSPEKVRTGREDYRGDIYSLGATLYHLFGGKPPFRGGSDRAIMDARLEVEPLPLQELRPDVPAAAARMIHGMLSRDRDSRPQDYSAVITCMQQERRNFGKTPEPAVEDESSSNLKPTRRTSGEFPRLVLRESDSARDRIAKYREAARRSNKRRGLSPLDWFLILCVSLVLLVLVLHRFAGGGDETNARQAQAPQQTATIPRPRPADLNFRALKTEIEDYLNTLPQEQREQKKKKLKLLVGIRFRLPNQLNRFGYEIPEEGLLLRSGDRKTGSLRSVDEEGFKLSAPGSRSAETVRWSQLAVQQIVELHDFLIQKWHEARSGSSRSPYAAQEALRAAALSEWFGRSDLAESYVEQALELDPKIRSEVRELFPSLVPES
ncbi:MAG: serine/threonine-protein kinase [Verrucomicrobiota bacterium]